MENEPHLYENFAKSDCGQTFVGEKEECQGRFPERISEQREKGLSR